MIRQDESRFLELLEDSLSAIESGASRADALEHSRLEPGARRDLAGLLQTADALRELPLPQLSAVELASQRSHLLAAAAERNADLESARGADAGAFSGRGPWLGMLLLMLAGALLWRFGSLPDLGGSSSEDGSRRTAPGMQAGAIPTDVRLAPAETAVPTRDLAMATTAIEAPDKALAEAAPNDILGSIVGFGQGLAGLTPSGATITPVRSPTGSPTPMLSAPAANSDEPRSKRATATAKPPSRSPATFSPTPTTSPTPTFTMVPSDTPTLTPSPTVTPSLTPEEPHGEAVLEVHVGGTDGGGPIAGAEVVAEREDGGPSVVRESNADGNARLVLVAGQDYRLRADAEGRRRRWWPNVAEREQSQLIRLAAGQSRGIEMNLPPILEQQAIGTVDEQRSMQIRTGAGLGPGSPLARR